MNRYPNPIHVRVFKRKDPRYLPSSIPRTSNEIERVMVQARMAQRRLLSTTSPLVVLVVLSLVVAQSSVGVSWSPPLLSREWRTRVIASAVDNDSIPPTREAVTVARYGAATAMGGTTASAAASGTATHAQTTTRPPSASPAPPLDLSGFKDVADRATPIVGLVVAPVLCFFGLAWYPLISLTLGFLAGGTLFALGAFLLVESYSTAAVALMLAAFATGGAVVGSVLRLRPAACSFLVGGAVGVALALVACFVVADVSSLARPSGPSGSSASALSGAAVALVSLTRCCSCSSARCSCASSGRR